ncbi:NAD-dependent epimerase/dehydratase family protein [Staphylococcus aureus]
MFVTGATGLIGIKLVQRLKERGTRLLVLLHLRMVNKKLVAVNVKAYIGDILKADTIDQAISTFLNQKSLSTKLRI